MEAGLWAELPKGRNSKRGKKDLQPTIEQRAHIALNFTHTGLITLNHTLLLSSTFQDSCTQSLLRPERYGQVAVLSDESTDRPDGTNFYIYFFTGLALRAASGVTNRLCASKSPDDY